MKKLAIILLGLFPLVLSSCLKEEEDYFDKSASARIEEAVKNAISVLEGAENGWAVKYYPNPTQTFGGFNLFFKFDDGTVTVSSEIESASTTATSLYSVGQEAGPTLAIDTKNELINYFAHPRNPDGYGSNYKGLEGDYLWTVLSATPEKVMLRGVKSGSLYTLTPLETSDWASEMQAYKNAASDMEFPSYVCVVKGDSLECITTSEGKFLYRNLTIRQETDKGIESYAAPFIYTKTGIELYEPLTINGVTAQKLDLKEEYYFANEDDSFIISGPKPVTSDNILTYGAVETTFNTVKVTVTPSNSDTYYVAAFLPSEITGYTDKQLRNAICDLLAAGDLYSGEKTLTFNYLYDQAEYILVGFGIDATTMASTTKIFRQSVTTGTLPDTMADGYKAWLGTWTVTSTSSEKSKTAYSFDIEIRPRTIDGTYLVRGWGYTVIKDDYEVDANYVSSTKGFQLFKREVGTLGDGGALTLLPRILNHQTNAYGLLNTSAYLLYAKPDGEGKGNITGREGSLSGGGTFTIVSADFWNVKNGSNYYLQAMDPYTYQDFFVGPYTMVRKSTDYGPSGRSVANAMGIEERQAATAVTMPHDVKVPFRAEE